ncbi:hypothetical protein RND81_03G024700 [Saponaria officinalis]|uniref:Aminotransferase-like plant mobile domain-containing protein n=1 Tax=Saponaria officinalis TaxID=3572 RepID=A0AAW1M4U5_SAPOF
MDWGAMSTFDWVSPTLGLTIKYCRDAVRPDVMDQGSKPSLVFPGFIMESWVFSHFPGLMPHDFVAPSTYPAVHAWATCDRSLLRFSYSDVRRLLNEMTYEKFVPKPWGRYTGLPVEVLTRFQPRDHYCLYLPTPFDSFWYLGERLAHQTRWDRLIVPTDPPSVLFVQTPDPVVRSMDYFEGLSHELLLHDLDYGAFSTRLAPREIEAFDPDMVHQPPEFFDEVEYEYGGVRQTVGLPNDVPTMVADYGMDNWSSRVKKVARDIYRSIWRKVNRWRELAARRTRELCQSRAETERLRAERDEFERAVAEQQRRREEAEHRQVAAERRSAEMERRQAEYDQQRADYERQLEEYRRMYPGHFMS